MPSRLVFSCKVKVKKHTQQEGTFWSYSYRLVGIACLLTSSETTLTSINHKASSSELTLDGHLRTGSVQMHKDLLLPNDTCIGGGFWEIDPISMKLLLSGTSYDYGKPKWNFVTDKLYVPKDYEGLRIEYNGNNFVDYVCRTFAFELTMTDMKTNELDNKIIIYQTDDGKTQLDVKLENETVWLTQAQMAERFQKDRTVIGRHIRNIFKEGELDEKVVSAKIAHTTQHGAIEGKTQRQEVTIYNLDVVISVGYRVHSVRGTRFRQWANGVLKDYLIKGYAINQRIREKNYQQMVQLVRSMARTVKLENLTTDVRNALLDVVVDYTYALDRLDDYDYQRLTIPESSTEEKFHATYEGAMKVLEELREKFGGNDLFANQKDDSFKSSIGQIYQTFDCQELYPTVEEKAAMLLYLITKNHSFSDGNKRIAATLFLWFMNENGILYDDMHNKRIDDATLVALTLLIAESRPEEKDTMVKVVVNLIGNTSL